MKKVLEFLKKHKKLVIFLVIAIAVVALGVYITKTVKQAQELLTNSQNSASTEVIEKKDIVNSITATGHIVASQQRTISTTVTGVDVKELNVSVGDMVNAGDVICVLDGEELATQLSEAQIGRNADAGRSGIDVAASNRNLNDAITTRDIDAQRAKEDTDSAYSKLNDAAGECSEAENNYKDAKNATNNAKSKMDSAQSALDAAKKAKPKSVDDAVANAAKASVTSAADAYNTTVNSIGSYVAANSGTSTLKTIDTSKTEVAELAADYAMVSSNNTASVATDMYTGDDPVIRAEIEARLSELSVKAQAFEQAVSEYERIMSEPSAANEAKKAAAEAQLAQAKAEYEAAKAKEESYKSMYEAKVSSVEAANEAYGRTLRSVEDLKRNDDMTVAARVDGVNNSKINAGTATIGDDRTIRQIEDQLSSCTVTATISGMVTAVNVTAGEMYAGGAIVTIEDTSKYEVSAQIDEYDIPKVSVGQSVIVKTNGTGSTELEGVVKEIAPHATANPTSNEVKYEVRISILTPNDDIRLDMTAKIEIVNDKREGVLSIASEAIQKDEDGKEFVEILDSGRPIDSSKMLTDPTSMSEEDIKAIQNGEATYESHKVYVTVGLAGDYYTEISGDGLEEGMEVVVPNNGAFSDIEELMNEVGAAGGM